MNKDIFIVANCRGKKPVITDLKRICRELSNIKRELNPCKARTEIDKALELIRLLLIEDNPHVIIWRDIKV